jgi:hypothetical protein
MTIKTSHKLSRSKNTKTFSSLPDAIDRTLAKNEAVKASWPLCYWLQTFLKGYGRPDSKISQCANFDRHELMYNMHFSPLLPRQQIPQKLSRIQEHKISEIMFLPYAIDQILVNDEAVKAEQESDRSRETTKETPTCKRLLKECRRSSRDCCRSWYSRGHTSRCPFWFRMLGKGPPSPSSSSSSTSSGLSNIETSSTSPSPCMHM